MHAPATSNGRGAHAQTRLGLSRPATRPTSTSTPDVAAIPIRICCATWLPTVPTSTQPGDERADDGADGVGGVDAADEPPRILPRQRHRAERQRKAGAPQQRGRQHAPRWRASDRAGS